MRATCLLLALLFAQVFCKTVYLSADAGSDDNEGTESSPYQSFGQAFNSTGDGTSDLEIYVYGGKYGGVNNTGLIYPGALTITWFKNSSENDTAATQLSAEIDCSSASGVVCLSSGTSITINGFDDDGLPKIIFEDCSICISVNKTEGGKESDYFLDIQGTTFSRVSQYALDGSELNEVTISNCTFSDSDIADSDGLTLVFLLNIEGDVKIENSNFNAKGQNSLVIYNTTLAELDNNVFTESKIFIQGLNEDSQIIIDTNTFSGAMTGVPALQFTNGKLSVKNSKFTISGVEALSVSSSQIASIINTSFEGSSITGNGGAAYFDNVETVTISENCYFSSNVATHYGGAIYADNSTVHLDATNFTLNVALDGAAIGCSNGTNIYYDNTTVVFTNNDNTGGGSASDIQSTCVVQVQSFHETVFSSPTGGSDAWIWILVSIAIVIVVLIIIAAVVFVIYQRKRQSYTRMD